MTHGRIKTALTNHFNLPVKSGLSFLDSPPVGKFYKIIPSFDPVHTGFILYLVVIDTQIKHSPRVVHIAEEDAVVELFIIIIVIGDQAEGESPGELEIDPLAEDVDIIDFFSSHFFEEAVVLKFVKGSQVGKGFESEPKAQRCFIAQIGVFRIIDSISKREGDIPAQPG